MFVDIGVEQAFAATFDGFATALVESNIGYDVVVEAHFAGSESVEARIGIEECALKVKAEPVHGLEDGLKVRFQFVGIVMIASDDACCSHDVAIYIRDGQDVRSFGFLTSLIGYRLAAFLGNGMATVEIDLR